MTASGGEASARDAPDAGSLASLDEVALRAKAARGHFSRGILPIDQNDAPAFV